MPANARRFARLDAKVPVIRRRNGAELHETVTNISRGGMSLSTAELLRPGELVALDLLGPGGDVAVSVHTRVRHVRSVDQDLAFVIGLELVDVETDAQPDMDRLLVQLMSTRPGHAPARVLVERDTVWKDAQTNQIRVLEITSMSLGGATLRGAQAPAVGTLGRFNLPMPRGVDPAFVMLEATVTGLRHEGADVFADVDLLLSAGQRTELERALRTLVLRRSPSAALPSKPSDRFKVGPFEVTRALGAGGMCEVYEARGLEGPLKDQTVALKRLRAQAAEQPGVRERFFTEADLGRMLAHPNIVRVHTGLTFGNEAWLAMERIEGRSLSTALADYTKARKLPPIDAVVATVAMVLDALEYCHHFVGPTGKKLEVVHGDVTPTNVLIAQDGTAKLTDFGAATTTLIENIELEGVATKLPYLVPELIKWGRAPNPSIDVYQAGVMLYEGLTTLRPFEGDAPEEIVAAAERGPIAPNKLRPDIPAAVADLILRAVSAEPERRPASAAAFKQELLKAASIDGQPLPALAIELAREVAK